MGICNGAKRKNKPIKSTSLKTEEEKVTQNSKKETKRTSANILKEKGISNGKLDESKIEEKAYFNNDTDTKNNKHITTPKNGEFHPTTTIEKIINQTQPKQPSDEERIFIFNKTRKELDDLYFINEFPISPFDNYSTDSDYEHIIHNRNIQNRIQQSSMLLSLKERRWNKESIALSDMIKENRNQFNSNAFNVYLKSMIQLQEHFNWLVWSLVYYYYCAFYSQNAKPFSIRDKTLPFLDSVEWLSGFEWKGLFVRVQSKDKSSSLYKEIKGHKFAFCDYIQIIQSNNQDKNENHLLSNELIFPLMAYGEFCGLILYATTCIKKYNYEEEGRGGLENFEEKHVFDLANNKNRLSFFSNNVNVNVLNKKSTNKIIFKPQQRSPLNKPKIGFNDISRIDKNSEYSLNISQNNIKNDICLKNYSVNDLSVSKILSKIKESNLIKVLDDIADNTTNKEKFKYMLINASDLIPNLFEFNSNTELNFISLDNNTQRKHFYDLNNLSNKSPIELIEKEFKMKINIKEIKYTEMTFEGLQIKVIYNEEHQQNNKEDDDSFISNVNKEFSEKIIKLPFLQNEPLTNQINSTPEAFLSIPETKPLQLNISNENIIQYNLLNPLKQSYSLIRHISSDNSIDSLDNDFLIKSNYLDYYNSFWKKIDCCCSSIRSIHHLKRETQKYGINSSLLIFALPVVQSKWLSSLIKISLFTKAIKSFIDYHESSNLMIKFLLYENRHDINVLREPGFDFLSKDNCLKEIRKEKIFYLIKSILSPNDIINTSRSCCKYVEFIMEQLSFFIFIHRIKWKRLNDIIGFNLLKTSPLIYEAKSLLKEFIQASRQLPFIFLSNIEERLGIVIDPFIKFNSSISLESFNEDFKLSHLTINEPIIKAFIDPKEISSFILVKCLNLSHLSSLTNDNSNYPKFNSFKGSLFNAPRYLQAKVNIDDYIKSNSNEPIDLSEDCRNDNNNILANTTHVNSQTVNNMVIDNISMYSNNTNKSRFKMGNKRESNSKLQWKAIKNNIHFSLEPIVYKMKYQYQQYQNDSFLKPLYETSNLDSIREWMTSVESILLGIKSCTAHAEESLLKCYVLLFIVYFYIDDDLPFAKSTLMKIREVIKTSKLYSYSQCAIINLLEGLASDKYIDSEEFFSKTLIFSLFEYGDPKGRRMKGHQFNMFPLWKLARQTCILESQFTNEYFKELFHSQDYNIKFEESNDELINNYYNRQVKYTTPRDTNHDQYNHTKNKDKKRNKDDNMHHLQPNDSNHNSDDDLNEMTSLNENFINNNVNEINVNYSLNENNIDALNNLHIKPFFFPPTSDIKICYKKFFHSKEYISFILQTIMHMDNDDSIHLTDEYYSLISMKPFNDEIDLSKSIKYMASPKIISNKGKRGNQILSHYIFDELIKKLSYRSNCPDGTIISFGKNTHMETCHDYYEILSLPRILYKLKDDIIDSIYSGWEHSIVIDNKGNCLSWGRNQFGQCGVGFGDVIKKPTRISFDSPNKIKEISCGNDHSLALNDQGVMYSFGNFEDGVLGIDSKKNEYSPVKISLNANIIAISSGTLHNMALTTEGKIYTWGSTKGGQLGLSQAYFNTHPENIESVPKPTLVPEFHSKIIKISSGEAHSLVLTEKGLVYSWGFGSNGQLGLGFCEDSFEPGTGMVKSRVLTPQLISSLPDIIDIQSGKTFSMFITNRRELYACGVNDLKQLGIEEDPEKSHLYHKDVKCYDIVRPFPIECFLNMKVKKISCGEGHCLAIIQDLMSQLENVWTWGNNHFGQLGIGNQIKSSLPKPLSYMLDFKKSYIADISCGGFHSLILLKRKKKYDEGKEYEEIEKIINQVII